MQLPKIRQNLLVQDLSDEILIYDKNTDKSYCLNSTAKIVFNACDGKKTFADIKLPKDVIYLSLDELKKNKLIEDDYASPFAGMTRREAIRKVGLASMVILPVISLLIAPQASHAASGCTSGANGRELGCPCSAITQCQPPANRCCVSSPPSPLNGTCQSNNIAVGITGLCGNSCTCISNCCAAGRCVDFRTLGSGSACSTGCQCSSGTCSGGFCT